LTLALGQSHLKSNLLVSVLCPTSLSLPPLIAPGYLGGLLSFAASEIAADEFAAKNRPPCNGPPI